MSDWQISWHRYKRWQAFTAYQAELDTLIEVVRAR